MPATAESNADREREWADGRNWSDGVFPLYFSKSDDRLWVPKRPRWTGFTLNLAHRHAALWLVGLAWLAMALAVVITWAALCNP